MTSQFIDTRYPIYGAGITNITPAAAVTDIFTISGSATKTVRVLRLEFSGQSTAGGNMATRLIVRVTADTGGTSVSIVPVKFDQSYPASTATVTAYTANPTLGNAPSGTDGIIFSRWSMLVAAAGQFMGPTDLNLLHAPVTLSGVAQSLCLNLNGSTQAGNLANIYVQWIEI